MIWRLYIYKILLSGINLKGLHKSVQTNLGSQLFISFLNNYNSKINIIQIKNAIVNIII